MFVLLYITRLLGITSTIAIAIGPRHVYTVIYKGAKNKIVGQKIMKRFACVCFKVVTLNTIFVTKMMSGKCKNVLSMGYIYHKKKNLFQNKLR